jgi:hypothetical protein
MLGLGYEDTQSPSSDVFTGMVKSAGFFLKDAERANSELIAGHGGG